ncbi:MAG: hypothetical protein ABJC89_04210, partial [Acidobacteriota bacterium]
MGYRYKPAATLRTALVLGCLVLSAQWSAAQGSVQWTNLVRATAGAGGSVQKITGCAACPDAGATSVQVIAADGYAELVPAAGHRMNAGLGTSATPSTDPARIQYGFAFYADGGWDVRESGAYRRDGRWAAGDVFRIVRMSGRVKYFKNASAVYVSAAKSSGSLVVDTTIYTNGAAFTAASASAPVVTAPDVVRVPAGADLQAALNAAKPGQTLVLDAGARYVGNFMLPERPAGGVPITLTSSANVPPAGQRVDPALVSSLAIIETPNNLPAIDAMT